MEEARLHELRLANCLQKYLDHQTMYRKLQPQVQMLLAFPSQSWNYNLQLLKHSYLSACSFLERKASVFQGLWRSVRGTGVAVAWGAVGGGNEGSHTIWKMGV
jgi:hypothetical protein